LRIIFAGSPSDAVPALTALAGAGHDIVLVVTQPDRRRGRGSHHDPSPVRAAAEAMGLPVVTPSRAGEALAAIRDANADLGVVVAFGQLIPGAVLDAVPLGFVNVHFSLLPRWRGAAPVERAILAGDSETGVCIMRVEEGLDTGPVYDCRRLSIGADETAGELRARLVPLGADLLVDVVAHITDTEPTLQAGEPTYAAKLEVEEFHLDPHRPAVELQRLVRAGNPRPGAWMTVDGRRVKVLRTSVAAEPGAAPDPPGVLRWPSARLSTAAGALQLHDVQVEGRQSCPADAWLAGYRRRVLRLEVT
jgi:methionyl-tRNA formyltransferase